MSPSPYLYVSLAQLDATVSMLWRPVPPAMRSRAGGSTGAENIWVCCDDDEIHYRDIRGTHCTVDDYSDFDCCSTTPRSHQVVFRSWRTRPAQVVCLISAPAGVGAAAVGRCGWAGGALSPQREEKDRVGGRATMLFYEREKAFGI